MFLQNGIILVLFGLSYFAGGVVNVFYAADNSELHRNLCSSIIDTPEFCNDLQTVVATEAASGVS